MIAAFLIIFIHWIADFVCQTDEQAKGKSSNNYCLLSHTLSYTLVWIPFALLYVITHLDTYIHWHFTLFIAITFMCHTIQDYFTSRLNTKLWLKGDVHNFFVSIGFDQVLHYGQLFLTFYLLI